MQDSSPPPARTPRAGGAWERYSAGLHAMWASAVARFSCPFCGRAKGYRCKPVVDELERPERPDLVKPHEPRIALLTETDPAIIGSFS